MKIALLTYDFPPTVGGVQTFLYEIASYIGQRHEVVVVTPAMADRQEPFRRIHAPKGALLGSSGARTLWSMDRIIVGHAHPRLLLQASLSAPGRYLTIAHGNDFLAGQRRWHRPLFNRLLRRSRPLITNSEANKRRLQQLGAGTAQVVSPGVHSWRFRPRDLPLPFSPPRLLTVGRLVPRKGIDLTLRAISMLLPDFPGLSYRIVGTGPDRPRLEALVAELGVTDCVHFLGRVPADQLAEQYRDAHVFVMPTREEPERDSVEGFGIVYLEASASGLPVVAGRSGGAVEAVREGETGLLVSPEDPAELTGALHRLLSNEGLCRRMGKAGRAWTVSEMNWGRVGRAFIRILEREPRV